MICVAACNVAFSGSWDSMLCLRFGQRSLNRLKWTLNINSGLVGLLVSWRDGSLVLDSGVGGSINGALMVWSASRRAFANIKPPTIAIIVSRAPV